LGRAALSQIYRRLENSEKSVSVAEDSSL